MAAGLVGMPHTEPWQQDESVVGRSIAGQGDSVLEPVSLQRANTWKDTEAMRASQYLKHVAKMERAASERAGWMKRRQRFRAIAKEMRERSGNTSHVFGDKFFDGRVRKWLAEAQVLGDMGFSLGAAVMAMETKGGRMDEAVTWLSSGQASSTALREKQLLQYMSAVERATNPAAAGASSIPDPASDAGNVNGLAEDVFVESPPEARVSTLNGNFTLGQFKHEALTPGEKQRVHTDSGAVKIKAFPNRMRGGQLIMTPDSPEARSSGIGMYNPDTSEDFHHLSFVVEQRSRVYVCVDHKQAESGQAPTWLAAKGYTLVPDAVVLVADELFGYYVVYRADFSVDATDFVVLGPNASGVSLEDVHGGSRFHHYFAVVVAEPEEGAAGGKSGE